MSEFPSNAPIDRQQAGKPADPASAKPGMKNKIATTLPGMPAAPRAVRFALAAIAVLAIYNFLPFSIMGVFRWLQPPQGLIFVDSPEVYTRERLINERSSEEVWLNRKLDEADSPEALAGITRLIEKRIQIGAGAEIKDGDKPLDGPAAKPGDYLSFDQKVRLQGANRDFILQKIVENRLDDRHDLAGNSLYILKFDTTVVANDHSNRRALVRIGLISPLPPNRTAGSQGQDKSGIFTTVLDTDDRALTFMNTVYNQFLRDAPERLNRVIGGIVADATGSTETQIKQEVAKEFGISSSQVSITHGKDKVEVRDPAAKPEDPKKVMYQVYLDFAGVGELVQFVALTGDPKLSTVPVFSSAERKINFELIEESCKRLPGKQGIAAESRLTGLVTIAAEHTKLRRYFGLKNDDANVRFYSSLHGYILEEGSNQSGLMTLLEKSMPVETTDQQKHQNDLLAMRFEALPLLAGNQPVLSREAGDQPCQSISVSLRTGLMNFINKARDFNNYAYSALPRQSPVAIVDDIVESVATRLPAPGGGSFWESLGFAGSERSRSRGAALQSRVTSFGELTEGPSAGDGSVTVGWIIDPLAGNIGESSDRMVSTADSVMAIVSVPSWWPHLRLRIKREWLEPDGSTVPAKSLADLGRKAGETERSASDAPTGPDFDDSERGLGSTTESPSESTKSAKDGEQPVDIEYVVNLPYLRNALEAVVIRNDNRQPSIGSVTCENRAIADKGAIKLAPQCVIRGNRLWRNPVVLAGVSRHSRLTVLPNMEGLLVEFESGVSACENILSVWTSEGVANKQLPPCVYTPGRTNVQYQEKTQ
jgi:hypothetical protein